MSNGKEGSFMLPPIPLNNNNKPFQNNRKQNQSSPSGDMINQNAQNMWSDPQNSHLRNKQKQGLTRSQNI